VTGVRSQESGVRSQESGERRKELFCAILRLLRLFNTFLKRFIFGCAVSPAEGRGNYAKGCQVIGVGLITQVLRIFRYALTHRLLG